MKMLDWWDWLTLPPATLEEYGYDVEERYRRTGHKRALSLRWACTVGHWGLAEPKDLMAMAWSGNIGRTQRSAYNGFRRRWGVRSLLQQEAHLFKQDVPLQYALAEEAYAAVATALDGEEGAAMLYGDALRSVGTHLGILPIEADLYYMGLTVVCRHFDLGDVFDYFRQRDRHELWKEACVRPWLPDLVAARYAKRYAEASDD